MDDKIAQAEERIECPKCGCHHFLVKNTTQKDGTVRRRRICRLCSRPIHTREIPEALYKQLMDPKKN